MVRSIAVIKLKSHDDLLAAGRINGLQSLYESPAQVTDLRGKPRLPAGIRWRRVKHFNSRGHRNRYRIHGQHRDITAF